MIIFLGIISLNGIFAVIFNCNLLRNKNEILETDLLDKQEGNLKLKLGWKFNTYFIFSLFILLLGLYGIRDLLIIIFVSVNQKIPQVSYLIYITFIIFGITFLYDCFKIKRSFNSSQKFVQDQTKPTNVNRNPKLSKKSENPINSRSKPSKATNQNVPNELSDNHQTEKSLLAENKMSKRVEYQLEFTKICKALNNEVKEQDKKLWDYYLPYYSSLINNGHLEAFAYLVTKIRANSEENSKWLNNHADQLEKFRQWDKAYHWENK